MLILLVLFARLVICYNGRQVCNRSNAGTHITLLKDVFLNCNGTIGNGDVVSASQHCKDNDKCSVFVVYNGQVTFCNYNPDAKVEGLKNINGSWVGISDRLEALANMKLTNKGDMICEHAANADDKEKRESLENTQPLATSPSFLTLESLTKNCNSWASSTGSTPMLTGTLRNKDSPHTTKMRGCVCGLSGSIRPDDYHHTYYAGDVVPVRPD
uniref:Uncharacterized protein n=1 Tax=Babesia bovis TaxID=5865 RepID=S6BED1_BABBO|nr:hypothetical protein BEWA_001180 [Babesia bovis]